MRIVIPDDYQNVVRSLACYKKLIGHEVMVFHDSVTDVGELAARFADAEVLVLTRERTFITGELLDRLPKLKLISQTGRISSHLDLAVCTAHRVAVAEGQGAPYSTAELTWGLILSSRRFIPQEVARLKSGQWQHTVGYGLRGHTLGVWSYGKIGKLVAQVGRAFGMRVWVWGRSGSCNAARADGFEVAPSREAFFAESDVVSLHIRLNKDTQGTVTGDDLAHMKTDALIVNCSRAELIAPGALEAALKTGRPGFAAVDVFESEPIFGAAHPLLAMPNVVATPHLGYVERDNYELYFGMAFDNVVAFASGTPKGIANPEVL